MRLLWSRQQPWGWWILFKKIFPVDPSSIICINLYSFVALSESTVYDLKQLFTKWTSMGHHGANFQSDLVLIPVEKTQGLEAFPFSQPPLQSRSVVLTSLELRLQFLIQVHGGARISQSFHEHQSKEIKRTYPNTSPSTYKYIQIHGHTRNAWWWKWLLVLVIWKLCCWRYFTIFSSGGGHTAWLPNIPKQ